MPPPQRHRAPATRHRPHPATPAATPQPPAEGNLSGTRRRQVACYAIIVTVAIGVYLNTLGNALVYDDVEVIAKNPIMADPWNLWEIFTTSWVARMREDIIYRPLAVVTFALNRTLNEALSLDAMSTTSFHLVNVVLHGFASCLVFGVLRRLGPMLAARGERRQDFHHGLLAARGGSPAWHQDRRCARLARRDEREYREYLNEEQRGQPRCGAGRLQEDFRHGLLAFVAALLFAVHPLHTEAVAALVGRTELLAALFGLLFVRAHLNDRAVWIACLSYFLAMLSKESAIAFLPFVIVTDVVARDRLTFRFRRSYAWYAITGLGWLGMRAYAVHDVAYVLPFVDNPIAYGSVTQRVFTASRVHIEYLRRLFIPLGLSSDYSYNQIPIISTAFDPYVLALSAVVFLAGWIAWRRRRDEPMLLWIVLGYVTLFAPTAQFLRPIGTIMGERLAYTPSIAVCALLGYAAARLVRRHAALTCGGLACLVVWFGTLTVQRNATWRDETTFFRTQVDTAPRSAKALYNYGTILAKRGTDREAIEYYQRAIDIFPAYSEPLYNMGNALRRLGEAPEHVIAAYRSAIEFDPGHRSARGNLALVLLDLDRTEQATVLLRELEALDPTHPGVETVRARLLQAGLNDDRLGSVPVEPVGTPVPPEFQACLASYVAEQHEEAARCLESLLGSGVDLGRLRRTAEAMLSRAQAAVGEQPAPEAPGRADAEGPR